MDKETLRKEIDYHINIKNNLWLAIVATVSGTLAVFFALINGALKSIFVIIGILFTILLLTGYSRTNDHIGKLFKKLKKEEN